jgi:hypothetical protein
MAQFLNQEANPTVKDSAKGNTTIQPQVTMDWNDATDMQVSALERAAIQASGKTPAVTAGQSFAAGMGNSIIAAALRKASSPDFETDYNWDSKKTIPADPTIRALAPNYDEIEYLHQAVSQDDYKYRISQMLEQRERDSTMSANIVSGIAGSIIGDAPTLLAPMAAAGVTGRVGMAIRAGIRAADVGTAYYAQDQLGQSAGVTALIAGISGIDQLYDVYKYTKAGAKAADAVASVKPTEEVPRFDPDAPTKRTAPDTVVDDTPVVVDPGAPLTADKVTSTIRPAAVRDVSARKLKKPIQVLKGQQAKVTLRSGDVIDYLAKSDVLDDAQKAILNTLRGLVDDIPMHLTGNPSLTSEFSLVGKPHITMRASKQHAGKTWNTVGDALKALDSDTGKVAVHEMVHAATVKAMRSSAPEAVAARQQLQELSTMLSNRTDIPSNLKYFASKPEEMLAGLADSKEWVQYLDSVKVGEKSLLRQMTESIMRALGFKGTDTALSKTLDAYESIIRVAQKDKSLTRFRSESMSFGENLPNTAEGNEKLLTKVKEGFKQNFALYDNIAAGNKDLADLLVSDGAAVGARKPSVTDYKRNLTLEMDSAASVVEDAIVSHLKNTSGIGMLDRFFHRSKFINERKAVEDKLAKYLDDAYDAEVSGRAVPVPSDDIAPIVKAYKDSGWATKWFDHMKNSGMVDETAELTRSDWYFPRQYSYDKFRQGLRDGNTVNQYRDLFRQALRDLYPEMDSDTVGRVAREMVQGIYEGRSPAAGAQWKQLINGMTNDELAGAMRNAGVDSETITSFMKQNVQGGNATKTVKNLRSRNRFNMTKEYMVDGKAMRLGDLMDTDVAKVMHGYTNRMSGRVGMRYAGIEDMKVLEDMIQAGKHSMPNPDRWEKHVNDTIDFLIGGSPNDADLPEYIRAASNLANATMLKNSALYQITDMALAMREFGMARVLRGMGKQEWFKQGAAVFKDKDMSGRLDNILRGTIQKEMRFRWLNTYADDNLDLTKSSTWFNITQNIGQAAKHVNGMSMVHRAQVNLNSGLVADELKAMLNGSVDSVKRLERWGLDPEMAKRMQESHKANPDKMLPPDLQIQLEVIGTRMMDYVVQQVRTGETSHFAQFNPVGKVIVGYTSFAVAATNKILRHEMNDAGWIGLAHIMAYQFPLMLLVMKAKEGIDGKPSDDRKLIIDAVMNMSALGGISLIAPIFTGEKPRHSLTSMAYITSTLSLLQQAASGNLDAQSLSRQLPLVQEFMPTRAIINNFGD